MKKIITTLFLSCFLLVAHSEDLTSFMGINFGIKKGDAVKIIKSEGWKIENNEKNSVICSNPKGSFLGQKYNLAILTFSEDKQLFAAGSMVISPYITNEMFAFYKKLKKIYEVDNIENENKDDMSVFTMYTKSKNRIIITLAPGFCAITFGINESGIISEKQIETSIYPTSKNESKSKASVNDIVPLIDMIKIPKRNYELSKTEVTQKLYFSVMGENPSKFKADNKPVENVNLYDAIYFCNKLSKVCGLRPCYKVKGSTDVSKWNYSPHIDEFIVGEIVCDTSANGYRLPTNEEWEYAAKCGKNYMYSGSDNPDDVAWYNGRSNEGPHVVATKKSNSFGLYDMSGNVDEWCWKFRSDKMPDSQSSVARGGNWGQSFLIPLSETSSVDISYGASYRSSGLGFRICRKQ